jgi:hypothetical protein
VTSNERALPGARLRSFPAILSTPATKLLLQALLVSSFLTLACGGSKSEASAPPCASDKNRGQGDGNRVAAHSAEQ